MKGIDSHQIVRKIGKSDFVPDYPSLFQMLMPTICPVVQFPKFKRRHTGGVGGVAEAIERYDYYSQRIKAMIAQGATNREMAHATDNHISTIGRWIKTYNLRGRKIES